MVTALSAIANKGVLMRPTIVKEITGTNENARLCFGPDPLGMVIDERWAKELTEMMVGVTERGGTGSRARVKGFKVAGKTGTAQKVDPETGSYSKKKYVASFMGFVPAYTPRLAIIIVVDEPSTNQYGGIVAAPVFARVAKASMAYLGIFPVNESLEYCEAVVAPQRSSNVQYFPTKDKAASRLSPIKSEARPYYLPNLRNLSVREAISKLAPRGLEVVFSGTGRVLTQHPQPGTIIKPPASVSLTLERQY
jgi:cell division protein FtsI (penicillin-binding protein 3)